MTVSRSRTRAAARHSADHYRNYKQQLTDKGTVKKVHADSTMENIHGIKMKWIEFCTFLGKDRLQALVDTTKEDIMTFLKWLLDSYPRIRKRSTVHEYWRVLCMLYRKSVGSSLHARLMEEIRDYIDGHLTKTYCLDTTIRDKPVLNVDDVYLILHHHWVLDRSVFPDERQRLQLALLLLLSAGTATRPSALVYTEADKRKQREHYIGWEEEQDEGIEGENSADLVVEDVKTLCYEDVTLLLLPNPDAKRDLLAMEVKLKYTKGWKKRPNPKTFILTEVDAVIFDPILLMITIALLDGAFESDVASVDELLRIRVRAPRRSLQFRWRPERLKTPIFRQAERNSAGVKTSPVKALRYHTYLYFLQRLGLEAGFMQILSAYAIRRGAGEAVEAVATQPQLQQVMMHRDAATYQAYINQRVQCDVQAAFLGRPSSTALFKAVTHMSRHVDPRAPTGLKQADVDGLKVDPQIVRLRQLRDHLSREARAECGTLKQAADEQSEIYNMYRKAEQALRCAKVLAVTAAKRDTRQRFFDRIDTVEINSQLNSSLLSPDDAPWAPTSVEHDLPERRITAELICKDTGDLDDDGKLAHRIRTVTALLALCRLREAPRRQKPDRSWGITQAVKEVSDLPPFPTNYSRTQCIFCFGNACQPREVRLYNYATVYKTRDHVELHLKHFKLNESIPCPDPRCQGIPVVLRGRSHFMNHAAREHDYDIFKRMKRGLKHDD